VRIKLPVRLYRSAGDLKLQSAHTVDISPSGARLDGLKTPLDPGEVLEIECSNRSAPYRVVWSGERGTVTEGQAGLECLAVDADIWQLDLSQLSDGEALERARVVQRRLLPQENPSLTTLDYAGDCIQARMIGGDYYDFLDMGPGVVGFVAGGCCRKRHPGCPAYGKLAGKPPQSLRRCLEQSSSITRLGKFPLLQAYRARSLCYVFFSGIIAMPHERFITSIAGTMLLILLRRGGAVERLDATATVIGMFPDWTCGTAEVELETGDVCGVSIRMESRRQWAVTENNLAKRVSWKRCKKTDILRLRT